MNDHIDLSDADTEGLLLRSLSVLTDDLNQARADRRTLSDAIRDIRATAGSGQGEELGRIAYICGLPAIQNAMEP